MDIVKIIGVGLVALIIIIILKQYKPEFTVYVSIIAGAIILFMLMDKLNAVVSGYLKIPLDYLGAVHQDTQLVKAVMRQTPVSLSAPNARSARAYEQVAARLMDRKAEGEVKKRGMAAFFSQLISGKK